MNDPDVEGRDVQVLLDWVAGQPEAQLDDPGNPRVGMVGGSYGGGIQLVVAAIDCRVDAIVPIVAWHSLRTSLYRAEVPKVGWADFLVDIAGEDAVDPHVVRANEAAADGVIGDRELEWFEQRGPGELVEDIAAPALFVHGTVDTLFTLDEAVTNYRILRDNGVPTAMTWYCGGHGTCLTGGADVAPIADAALAWLQRWVADDPDDTEGEEEVDPGARVEVIDQHGTRYAADDYPLPAAEPIVARGTGTLELTRDSRAGPLHDPPPTDDGEVDLLRGLVLPITAAPADVAVEVAVPMPDEPAMIVGAPGLELTYRGDAPSGDRPTAVFAQLVDDATGLVVGTQITPVALDLDGETHRADTSLEIVSHRSEPGDSLTLQLVATSVAYAEPRLGGSVEFDEVVVRLPRVEEPAPIDR